MGAVLDTTAKHLHRTTNLPLRTACTICGWFKRTTDTGGFETGLACRASATGSAVAMLDVNATDSLILWVSSESAALQAATLNQWFFGALTLNGTTANAYSMVDTGSSLNNVNQGQNATAIGAILFGARGTGGEEHLIGKMGPIKVWDAVLNSTELLAEAGQMSPVRTSNLNSWFLCDSVQEALDQSGNGRNLTENGTITFDDDLPDVPLSGDPVYEQVSYRFYSNTGTGLGEPA
jgi:hypothetical protein